MRPFTMMCPYLSRLTDSSALSERLQKRSCQWKTSWKFTKIAW